MLPGLMPAVTGTGAAARPHESVSGAESTGRQAGDEQCRQVPVVQSDRVRERSSLAPDKLHCPPVVSDGRPSVSRFR